MENVDKKLANLRKALKDDLYYDREELMNQAVAYMGREEGIEIGEKIGLEKGKEEKKMEIAKEMLNNNLSTEIIVKCTGLSIEDINSLKDN